jgi:YVTN family beta-propeller protein
MKKSITSNWRRLFRALYAFFNVIAAIALVSIVGSAPALAQNAYITNQGSNTVSVIDTATNTVSATIPVGRAPQGLAVAPDGNKVYVANFTLPTGEVSVIETATNTVTATISVGNFPQGVAITPDGSKAYIANFRSNDVSVIVTSPISVGRAPTAFGSFIQ